MRTLLALLLSTTPAFAISVAIGDAIYTGTQTNSALPIVTFSDSTAHDDDTLAPASGGKTVHIGLSSIGGGYISYITLSGFGAIDGNNIVVPGYGRGFQSSIRDNMHSGRYNPTQSGAEKNCGATTTLTDSAGKVLVNEFAVASFMNNNYNNQENHDLANCGGHFSGIDKDTIDESIGFTEDNEIRSEMDFGAAWVDKSSAFKIPALKHDFYYAYVRNPATYNPTPGMIQQFDCTAAGVPTANCTGSGTQEDGTPVFDPTSIMTHISTGNAVNALPVDVSFMPLDFGIRLSSTYFNYVMYSVSGIWQIIPATVNGVTYAACRLGPADVTSWTYTTGKVAAQGNFGGALCPGSPSAAIDGDFMILATSNNPNTAVAVGLWKPMSGANAGLNINQCGPVSSGGTWTQENRSIQTFEREIFTNDNGSIEQKMNTIGNLSGMRNPGEVGGGAVDLCAGTEYILFGTPAQIRTAIVGSPGNMKVPLIDNSKVCPIIQNNAVGC